VPHGRSGADTFCSRPPSAPSPPTTLTGKGRTEGRRGGRGGGTVRRWAAARGGLSAAIPAAALLAVRGQGGAGGGYCPPHATAERSAFPTPPGRRAGGGECFSPSAAPVGLLWASWRGVFLPFRRACGPLLGVVEGSVSLLAPRLWASSGRRGGECFSPSAAPARLCAAGEWRGWPGAVPLSAWSSAPSAVVECPKRCDPVARSERVVGGLSAGRRARSPSGLTRGRAGRR